MTDRDRDRDLDRMSSRIADKVVVRITAILVIIFFLGSVGLRVALLGHGLGLLFVIAVLVGAVLIAWISRRS
ncbi:MAG: hypothetical protein ACLPTJ_13590 [Solirubrobacteraceae bacterium]